MESMAVLTVEGALFFAFVRVIEISAVNTSEEKKSEKYIDNFFLTTTCIVTFVQGDSFHWYPPEK